MEVNIQQKSLYLELQLIQGIIEKRATTPILGHVLMEAKDNALKLRATDLDIWFETRLPCIMVKEGSMLVPARKLFEVMRFLPDVELTLESMENNWLHLLAGNSEFNLAGLSSEEFPVLPEINLKTGFRIAQNDLYDVIKHGIIAMHEEEGRFFIKGALLKVEDNEHIIIVSTDGHRLSYFKKSLQVKEGNGQEQESFKAVIPRKALVELLKVLDFKSTDEVVFNTIGNYVYFYVEPRLLIARLLEESFPSYSETIEIDLEKKMIIPKDAFTNAVKRVSIMANEKLRGIELRFADNQLELIARSSELGNATERIGCQYDGELFKVGFNADYLLDFLTVADSEEIIAEFRTVNKRAVLRPLKDTADDFRYVVMPMNIGDEEIG